MNEEMNAKPRKKKHSLWWLWFLLFVAVFAGGVILGLKLNTLPLPSEVKNVVYPRLEALIPGSTASKEEQAVRNEETVPAAAEPADVPAAMPAPAAMPEPAPAEETPAEEPAEAEPAPAAAPAEELEGEPVRLAAGNTAVFASAKPIGVDSALKTALDYAEVSKEEARVTGVVLTKDSDGRSVYEVGFLVGELTYEYVIDAVSGEICSWKISGMTFEDSETFGARETQEETAAPAAPDPVPEEPQPIGEEEALRIACERASVRQNILTGHTVELSQEEPPVYRVLFQTATRTFDYEIDAMSGEVISFENK